MLTHNFAIHVGELHLESRKTQASGPRRESLRPSQCSFERPVLLLSHLSLPTRSLLHHYHPQTRSQRSLSPVARFTAKFAISPAVIRTEINVEGIPVVFSTSRHSLRTISGHVFRVVVSWACFVFHRNVQLPLTASVRSRPSLASSIDEESKSALAAEVVNPLRGATSYPS